MSKNDQSQKTGNQTSYQLVIVRHGESVWNKENRFTGWKDVDLSEKGIIEAKSAGQKLVEQKIYFDYAYTSYLTRAIKTLNYILDGMQTNWLPVAKAWQLNERHYGELQGLNKAETAAKHGEDQVKVWRRSFSTPPPAMSKDHPDYPGNLRQYKNLKPDQIPSGESLEMTVKRVLPYWNEAIVPRIRSGENVLIVAHGNSLRSLILELEGLSAEQIMNVDLPTGIPLVYELDLNFKVLSKRYLASEDEVQAALHKVASQGKAKA
jgi:2,3-bisphosphoglycerate-dependent phosphoglycerate mutase